MAALRPAPLMGAAEAAWLVVTTRHPARRGGADLAFRRYGHVIAALHFTPDTIHLLRVESLAPGLGGFRAFLKRLRRLADAHELRIRGNALAYATADVPVPDQERLERQYQRCGFRIGPAPLRTLDYGHGVAGPEEQVA